MTYKEALLWIGKCLTLGVYPERIPEIRAMIRSGVIEWERIVWVSTSQYVFPALYLQLKRAGLLAELPADLLDYMEAFTNLNRERNQQIINEAHQITALLNKSGITPIFLKGTAHLLDGLYADPGERMVGDMDLLVDEKVMVSAAETLRTAGYQTVTRYNPDLLKITKHYPRLTKENCIAAVEIHRQILGFPEYRKFEYKMIAPQCRKLEREGQAMVLDDRHQIIHNILNIQLNDLGYYYARLSLRQGYDLLLLSKRENPLLVVQDYGKFAPQMHASLALTSFLFDIPLDRGTPRHWRVRLFLCRINANIRFSQWDHYSHLALFLSLRFYNYLKLPLHSLFDKAQRSFLMDLISDPKWVKQHLKSYFNLQKIK